MILNIGENQYAICVEHSLPQNMFGEEHLNVSYFTVSLYLADIPHPVIQATGDTYKQALEKAVRALQKLMMETGEVLAKLIEEQKKEHEVPVNELSNKMSESDKT
jgi:DNA-directed RNA polymerase subunit L